MKEHTMKTEGRHSAALEELLQRADVPQVVRDAQRQMAEDGTVPSSYVDYIRGGKLSLENASRFQLRIEGRSPKRDEK